MFFRSVECRVDEDVVNFFPFAVEIESGRT